MEYPASDANGEGPNRHSATIIACPRDPFVDSLLGERVGYWGHCQGGKRSGYSGDYRCLLQVESVIGIIITLGTSLGLINGRAMWAVQMWH